MVFVGNDMFIVKIMCNSFSRWEEEKKSGGQKWSFLEHKGPIFAPAYEPLPPNVKFFYDGKKIIFNI